MAKSKLKVVRAPQTIANPERVKRDRERRAEKRGHILGETISKLFTRPKGHNRNISLSTGPIKSSRLKVSGLLEDGSKGKRFIRVERDANFSGPIHRLDPESRRERRQDNREMKMSRLRTRGRNVHGRKGVSARKKYLACR